MVSLDPRQTLHYLIAYILNHKPNKLPSTNE